MTNILDVKICQNMHLINVQAFNHVHMYVSVLFEIHSHFDQISVVNMSLEQIISQTLATTGSSEGGKQCCYMGKLWKIIAD